MSARERLLAAFKRQPTDRVPTDIWATSEVWNKLVAQYGSVPEARDAFRIDGMDGVAPVYRGPPIPPARDGVSQDMWGARTQTVTYDGGAYQEWAFSPLAAARTIDDLERYPWPQADWFDCSAMREDARKIRQTHAVACGSATLFAHHNSLRGLEQSLMDPLECPEFTHHLLGKISAFFLAQQRRIFEACDGLIDVTQVSDDLGSQKGPLMSPAVYRGFYAPHHREFIGLAHEFGIKVLHHDDGSIRAFLPDLVEMGIDILNPVQRTCPGMDLAELKREFGGRICFHGAVENQRILPFGTPAEVRAEVRHCIDALASNRLGYILASCHNLQPNTPLANILAMYDEAWQYGKF